MKRTTALTTLFTGILGAAIGCQGTIDTPDEEVQEIAAALEQENGGLTMEDEAPMFGDPSELDDAELPEPTTPIDDAVAQDPEVAAMQQGPKAVVFRTTLLWGQVPGNPANKVVRHWDGKLSVNRGALLVRRAIAFEPKTDGLMPRTDKRSVAFRSVTLPHHDGLRLAIIDPTPEADEPLTLTYESKEGPVAVMPLAALVDGPKTKVVDDAGNRFVAMATPAPLDPCAHGDLHGRWHALGDDQAGRKGRFIGLVADYDGEPIGHMRGIYGVRKNGDPVFFGKYIDLNGNFKGIFRGKYGAGRYDGRWVHKSGDKGALGGAYRETIPGPEVGGHYIGRWRELTCNVPAGPGQLPPEL